LILAVLDRLPSRSKRWLIATTTFLAGLYYVLEFFLPEKASWYPNAAHANPLSAGIEIAGQIVQVILAFTLPMGAYNLIYFHSRNIRRQRPNWPFSVLFFAAFIPMTLIGFWHDLPTFRPGAHVPAWVTTGWHWLFDGMFVNL